MAETMRLGGTGEIFPNMDLALELTGVRDADGHMWDFTGKLITFDIRTTDITDVIMASQTATTFGGFDADPTINTLTARVEFTTFDTIQWRPGTYRYSWKCSESLQAAPLSKGDFIVESVTQH